MVRKEKSPRKENSTLTRKDYIKIVNKYRAEPETQRQGLLVIQHIPLETLNSWGKTPASQPFSELMQQIANRTSVIEETEKGGIIRKVKVTAVSVLDQTGQYRLVEKMQEYSNNTTRKREKPDVAVRMNPEEYAMDAAVRALQSKLGITVEESKILGDNQPPRHEKGDSKSFPGLEARYIIYDRYTKLDMSQYKEVYSMVDKSGTRATIYTWAENYGRRTVSLDVERIAPKIGGKVVTDRETGYERSIQVEGDKGERLELSTLNNYVFVKVEFPAEDSSNLPNGVEITNEKGAALKMSREDIPNQPGMEKVETTYTFTRRKRDR